MAIQPNNSIEITPRDKLLIALTLRKGSQIGFCQWARLFIKISIYSISVKAIMFTPKRPMFFKKAIFLVYTLTIGQGGGGGGGYPGYKSLSERMKHYIATKLAM